MVKTVGGVRGNGGASDAIYQGMLDVSRDAIFSQVEHADVERLPHKLSTDEIIARLGGSDKTRGSCASLAFAYAANKAGLDVLDYRGGKSQFFWSNYTARIMKRLGARTFAEDSGVEASNKALQTMKPGHEYILATGIHAAIVRRGKRGGYEYLELQHEPKDNGFKPLDDKVLVRRFRTPTTWAKYYPALILDCRDIRNTAASREMFGYIHNTGPQMKGAGGSEK